MKKFILAICAVILVCAAKGQGSSYKFHGIGFVKYQPLFGILGTEYARANLRPPNFSELCYVWSVTELLNINAAFLGGYLRSGDNLSTVKHEMKYWGVKLGTGFSMSSNPVNKSFVHLAFCIVPTEQTATLTFWDLYRWSAYSEQYRAGKTYYYGEFGFTFLINLNKAKNLHAIADLSFQIVPDNGTPFKQFSALENYDIIVPGAGSFEYLNPSLGVGFGYSF